MLIGITGTDGAGKGTVVDYLTKQKGFTHYSARAIWNKEIDARGIEQNRANMRIVANDLRKQHGNDFLITYYLKEIKGKDGEDAIIESIRALAEAETLKANGGILLAVDADQKLRYERVQKRRSESDQVSFEQFKEHEELENNDPDPHGMQKARVIEIAGYLLMNDGTVDELYAQIEEALQKIG